MAEEQDTGLNLGWFLAGVTIGAALGLLFAPLSGRETREYLGKKAGESKDALTSTGKDVADRSKEMFEKGRQLVDEAADLFERGRRLVRGEPTPPAAAEETAS